MSSHHCIAVIPARGGSKSIPKKNIRPFLNKPLIGWSINTARSSEAFDRIIVSTDDLEISQISLSFEAEVPFRRPSHLAKDDTSTAAVVRHIVEWLRESGQVIPDGIVILEPTSPGRQPEHIQDAVKLLFTVDTDSVASIGVLPHNHASEKQLVLSSNGCLVGIDGTHPKNMIHRRQETQDTYVFDGNIFACRTEIVDRGTPCIWGDHVRGLVVDSRYSVDLNYASDWLPAEEKLRFLLD